MHRDAGDMIFGECLDAIARLCPSTSSPTMFLHLLRSDSNNRADAVATFPISTYAMLIFLFVLVVILFANLLDVLSRLHVIKSSGVARPQATWALAWGVETNSFVYCSFLHYSVLFSTVATQLAWGVQAGWLRY
jgi:hypothetical protein